MPNVFICHRKPDVALAERVAVELRARRRSPGLARQKDFYEGFVGNPSESCVNRYLVFSPSGTSPSAAAS